MIYRTRFQRLNAVDTLLLDLLSRTSNPVLQEYCVLCSAMLAGPLNQRRAVEARVKELVDAADERRLRAIGITE